ncbi:rod shape-determining protein RodA [bacterium]|nr:rod shape-determining protein RodA [bacterium]MBU1072547.1 rod shape-determining protein RodA [bacterium]MBU1675006.1 rod shape-determining protein RodA [bacterium]
MRQDWLPRASSGTILLWSFAALCLFSLATLWSVTEGIRGPYEMTDSGVAKAIFWRQAIWIVIGWLALLAAMRTSLQFFEESAPLLYLGAVAMLVLVLAIAPEIAGARRWFSLGPLRLQPSEPAKIALVLVLARLFSSYASRDRQLLPVIGSLLLAAIPLALVLREPDLGTSLVYVALWLGAVYWFGLSWVFLLSVGSPLLSAIFNFYSESVVHQAWPWGAYLLVLMAGLSVARFRLLESFLLVLANIATGIGTSFLWGGLKPYQQERILTFFDPTRDQFGTGYQAIQSKVAIGSGGLFGTEYLQGTQKGLAFLPERHTDFIFSVVGEELGFIGALLLIGIYLVIILKGLEIARTARKSFSSQVALGVTIYFAFHVLVNIAITTGLLPVTGLPLPVMSYGGSNLVVSAFMLGLLVNIGSRTFES